MMEREWQEILRQYGQRVLVRRGEEQVSLRAFLQPVLEKGAPQQEPTPLGLGSRERFLYLGPPEQPLELDSFVQWQGREYRVQNTHKVGEGICPYWWAVLYPRDEVSP